MKKKVLVIIGVCVAGIGLFSCAKKTAIEPQPLVIAGPDTLLLSDIKPLTGESPSAIDLRRAALLAILSKRGLTASDSSAFASATVELADAISLETSTAWSPLRAGAAIRAATVIDAMLTAKLSPEKTVDSLNRLYRSIQVPNTDVSSDSMMPIATDAFGDAGKTIGKAQRERALVLAALLNLSPQNGLTVADVALGKNADNSGKSVKESIKGLVFDASRQKQKSLSPDGGPAEQIFEKAENPDNSSLALKFRTQKSITDSIQKHLPNLEALYRKQLKIHQDIRGVVIVGFRISANGKVISADIKKSDIRVKEFLQPFITYMSSIRFLSIPDKVGPMSFDFPFEFSPE
jgi:hypothetical protein